MNYAEMALEAMSKSADICRECLKEHGECELQNCSMINTAMAACARLSEGKEMPSDRPKEWNAMMHTLATHHTLMGMQYGIDPQSLYRSLIMFCWMLDTAFRMGEEYATWAEQVTQLNDLLKGVKLE